MKDTELVKDWDAKDSSWTELNLLRSLYVLTVGGDITDM